MKLVLIGAPGSGKGTLAQGLIKALNIPSISTGDLLRNSIANGTELGKTAKKYMDEGKLVPTELVLDLLKERLAEPDTKNGYILDGFPRSMEQAELLDSMVDIDLCLYLDVDKDVIVNRIAGRRTCKKCGAIYNTNTYSSPVCECGGELYLRDDDNEVTVAKRFDTFTNTTSPLVDFYRNKGILKTVKGQDRAEDTLNKALEIMK
ncbi:MAG: adenylate kinase [Clostridia bacterium]|nr:adenylate kinase [Clostridia bacterium]